MNPIIMWNQILVPILLPIIVNCQTINKTDDVFVAAGHAELDRYSKKELPAFPAAAEVSTTISKEPAGVTTKEEFEFVTESIVFIPNSRGGEREYEREEEVVKVDDVMNMRTVEDVLNNKNYQASETEAPQGDIYFVTGKNNDYTEKEETKPSSRRRSDDNKEEKTKKKEDKLDCKKLDCTNTLKGVCGAKYENNIWKYRFFLNECYFNKVNCQFKYEFNRYKQAPGHKCKDTGLRILDQYYSTGPKSSFVVKRYEAASPKSSSSRRSMSFSMNGHICSHPCPATCTDEYDPQCAVSGTGQKRMFVNHCKMDYNSCFFGVVWHKRPLAECVGGRKADMRQNRGFIGWMQRVGIVDKRGRLVLE